MNRLCKNTDRRRGFLLQEAMMAMLIVTLALVGAGQLLQLVANQQRSAEYRAIASLEVANAMEDLLGRRWSDLATAPQLELSASCRERLPSPELRVAIKTDSENTDARRIHVELDWQIADGRRSAPLQLVAWRYAPEEVQP